MVNELFARMHLNKYFYQLPERKRPWLIEAWIYNYTIYRRESYTKFMWDEKNKYEEIWRKIKDEDNL